MSRPVQYFTDEYLEQCKKLSPKEVLEFLDNFRRLNAPHQGTKLISMKVEVPLLKAFKIKAQQLGVPYQRLIKTLMKEWLEGN